MSVNKGYVVSLTTVTSPYVVLSILWALPVNPLPVTILVTEFTTSHPEAKPPTGFIQSVPPIPPPFTINEELNDFPLVPDEPEVPDDPFIPDVPEEPCEPEVPELPLLPELPEEP